MSQTKESVSKEWVSKRISSGLSKIENPLSRSLRAEEGFLRMRKLDSKALGKIVGDRTKDSTLDKRFSDRMNAKTEFLKNSSAMDKEAVGNIGEEEMSFIKHVRLTRDDTRRDANALFTKAHQSRDRDRKLVEKLFVQAPGAVTMAPNLQKEASAEQWEQFEKIKVAYNVHHFFESGAHMTAAQRRFPELLKVAKARPVVSLKKTPSSSVPTGETSGATSLPASQV